jgi:hypothetical protein
MQKIEVNGQECDISQEKEIAITKQVFDVFDIEARVNTVSTFFSLPKSMLNDAVTDNAQDIDSNQSFGYQNHSVNIFKDGAPIMQGGRLLVNGYNDEGLDCLAIDDSGNIYQAINAINWDDVVSYIEANIQSSLYDMAQTLGVDEFTGVWLGLQGGNDVSADYIVCPVAKPKAEILVSGNNIFLYQYAIPHVFVSRLLEVILGTVGATFAINGTVTDDWTNGAIPVDTLKITERAVASFNPFVSSFTAFFNGLANNGGSSINIVSCQFSSYATNASTITVTTEYTGTSVSIASGNIFVPTSTSVRISNIEDEKALILVSLEINGTIPACNAISFIRSTTSSTVWEEVYYEQLFGGGFSELKLEAEIERGDATSFEVAVIFWNATAPAPGLISGNLTQSLQEGQQVKGGMPFDLIGNLPFETPSDAFRFIISHYGFIPTFDKFSNVLTLNTQEAITTNQANAYDWSDKLDITVKEEATYYLEGLGQSTLFNFSNSDELGGQGSITVDATNLPEFVDFFESDAERSREVFYANLTTVEYDITKAVIDASTALGYDIDRTGSNGLRIVRIDASGTTVKVWTGSSAIDVPGYKVAVQGMVNDFQQMIDNYYHLIKAAYAKPKVVTAPFYLDLYEVETFDFTRPVYVEKFGRYFYVNSIDNFINGQPTSCTLIAI